MSYQFGAILQQNTAMSGPRAFRFGLSPESRQRQQSMAMLLKEIPPTARVAGASVIAPQLSNRTYAYDMNIGWFDADYLVVPTQPQDYIGNEKQQVLDRMNDGSWGVVKLEVPFVLLKRGHPGTSNGDLLNRIR